MAHTISDFMTLTPHSIGAEQSLEEAHKMMRLFRVRHLPVLHGGELLGVISQRDLHLIETLKDVDPKRVPVSDAVSAETYQVSQATDLALVAREMAQKKMGSAIVTKGKKVVGIFTTTDALRALSYFIDVAPTLKRVSKAAPSVKTRTKRSRSTRTSRA